MEATQAFPGERNEESVEEAGEKEGGKEGVNEAVGREREGRKVERKSMREDGEVEERKGREGRTVEISD